VFAFEQTGPILTTSFCRSGYRQWSVTVMTTSRQYRQFARECAKWADEATTDEAKKSLLDLASDWIFAALAVDRVEKQGAGRISGPA
jgi:hypothetical protein